MVRKVKIQENGKSRYSHKCFWYQAFITKLELFSTSSIGCKYETFCKDVDDDFLLSIGIFLYSEAYMPSSSSKSECFPCWDIRPLSSTTIWSAFSMVDNLWAITIVVLSDINFSSDSCTNSSAFSYTHLRAHDTYS